MKYWSELSDFDIKSISSYVKSRKLENYIFRGLPENIDDNLLETSFDKLIGILACQGIVISDKDRWKYEGQLLYEFKRRAHYYLKEYGVPGAGNFLEWLSLMRHYGSPSRLLDFTYSFYIALYFAVYRAKKDKDSCIVAINWKWLVEKVEKDLLENHKRKKNLYFQSPEVFHKYAMVHFSKMRPSIIRGPRPYIIPVRPYRSNERIHMQQGLFLCPANVNLSFEGNLIDRSFSSGTELKNNIKKIIIPKNLIPEIFLELNKMNIGSETLFTGLSGYAESLIKLLYKPIEPIFEERLKQSIESPEF